MKSAIAETEGIRVTVHTRHSPEHSDEDVPMWFFLYTIRIHNRGLREVQLLARHWEITDGKGRVEHVRGPGVVGKQPTLGPNQSFEYTSGCPLPTPFGFMKGEFEMVETQDGRRFAAEVPSFPLRIADDALH